jgi:adenine-specific DNA-methyltransferase
MLEALADNRIYWGADGKSQSPRFKLFLTEAGRVVPRSILQYKEVGHTQSATSELRDLLPEAKFDYPKPSTLLIHLLNLASKGDGTDDFIALDFFAGSGTTGHAVLKANEADKGNRKFIMVQLPETTGEKTFPNIADIAKERIRRVIKTLKADSGNGFKVFKLQSSNFKAWNAEQVKDEAALAEQLSLHVDHLVAGRSQEDVLYELLLKSGFPLDTPIEKLTLANKSVFSIAEGMMLVCLEHELTMDVLKAMANKKPERVVCLDAGFANNDQLKTNAVQTMKAAGVTKFQTV